MIIFVSFLTTFDMTFIFWRSWGSMEIWLGLKIETIFTNLACPNRWNTLYKYLLKIKRKEYLGTKKKLHLKNDKKYFESIVSNKCVWTELLKSSIQIIFFFFPEGVVATFLLWKFQVIFIVTFLRRQWRGRMTWISVISYKLFLNLVQCYIQLENS